MSSKTEDGNEEEQQPGGMLMLRVESKLNGLIKLHKWDKVKTRIKEDKPVRASNINRERCHTDVQYRLSLIRYQKGEGKEVRYWDSNVGMSPLHIACLHEAPTDVVEMLAEAYPTSATRGDLANNNLPIHYSCSTGMAVDRRKKNWGNARRLASMFPDTILSKNADKCTPLHCALESCPPLEVVADMVSKRPQVCEREDEESQLPLHVAVNYKCEVEVVRKLIETNREAVRTASKGGHLPLHLAAASGAQRGVIELLLEEYPGAVFETLEGDNPATPLHLVFTILQDNEMYYRHKFGEKLGGKKDSGGDNKKKKRKKGVVEMCHMVDMVKLMLRMGCRGRQSQQKALRQMVGAMDGKGYNVCQEAEDLGRRLEGSVSDTVLKVLQEAQEGKLSP